MEERAHAGPSVPRQQLSLVELPQGDGCVDDGFERLDVAAGLEESALEVATAALPKFTRAPKPNANASWLVVETVSPHNSKHPGFASPRAPDPASFRQTVLRRRARRRIVVGVEPNR